MKKFFITGALTLVAAATLTSCHTDDDFSGSIVEQKIQAYQQVFEEEFGKINPEQDWGFGTSSRMARIRGINMNRTRGNYANSNHWGATAESDPNDRERGWIVPDTLTDGQRLRVTRYFQTHPYLTYEDPHWTDFFVQQVYTGGTDPITNYEAYQGNNPKTGKSYSPEFYRSANKQSTDAADITSSNLNYLFAYGETEHINNFNRATSSYKPVLETGEDINNGKKHNDRINLMANSSTKEFSYQNSYSSVRHGIPYVALVSAQVIDDWADSLYRATNELIGENVYYGKDYNGIDNSYWNRSFLGCDLELLIGDEIYTDTYFQPGTYGNSYKYLINNENQFGGDLRKYPDNPPTGDELNWLLTNGYLPVINTADKDWVKPQPVADHYYSDWIVTLSKAKRQGEPDPSTTTIPIENGGSQPKTKEMYYTKKSLVDEGRVFCEDLGVVRASDIDFNDIVFDVYIYKTEYITKHMIKYDDGDWQLDTEHYGDNASEVDDSRTTYDGDIWLLAGGGTIPATIQIDTDNERKTYNIKDAFNQVIADKVITDAFIVNTIKNADGSYGNVYENYGYGIKLNDEPLAISAISEVDVVVRYGEQFNKLTAYKGLAPHKICVPITTKWLLERVEINEGYPDFTKYVKYQDKDGNLIEKYAENEGVTQNDGPEGGYVGDGEEYNTNYDKQLNSVWETSVSSKLYDPLTYTPRHQESGWTDSEVYVDESAEQGGEDTGSSYQYGDPVLVRRRN